MTRITTHTAALLALLIFAGPALACGGYGDFDFERERQLELRKQAKIVLGSHDLEERNATIAALRDAGYPGLDALFLRTGWLIHSARSGSQLGDAIDEVAGQKDAAFSRLFWHTDMDKAKAAAKAAGKPILSLRLLGKLTDEYSCANSRFFRTVLYANPDVAKYLRKNYVLHWESVRPVPVVTIDFGDGRTVKRTITGNSAHYVLDTDGRVIDVIPGLYTPNDFLRIVTQAQGRAAISAKQTDAQRKAYLAQYHRTVAHNIATRFGAALPKANVQVPLNLRPNGNALANRRPDAADAAPRAVGKMMVERPILVALDPAFADKLQRNLTADQWSKIAGEPELGSILHANSIALMRKQNPKMAARATEKFNKTVGAFEKQIAIDTVRNELLFRRVIHQWLASEDTQTMQVATLNARVYNELFLTPGSDPNLGLIPEYVYTALPE